MDCRSEYAYHEARLARIFLRAIVSLALIVVCTIILSVSYLSQKIADNAVVDAYNRGKKDALSVRPVSAELEFTCAALWMDRHDADRK